MNPQFKNIVLAVLPLAGVLLISPVVSAHHHDRRDEERNSVGRVSEGDLRSFDSYLDSHGETAQLLYQDPDLVNDRRFLRDHAALRDWLDDHADAAEAIRANPRQLLWRDRASQRRNPQSLD